jgi:choline dehydrogenase-like flavoprotein
MGGHYDIIIIGSGAGGGTLACHLASWGKRILLLERGEWLMREPKNCSAEAVFVENRYLSPEYDQSDRPFRPRSITSSGAPPRCWARRYIGCVGKIRRAYALSHHLPRMVHRLR